MAVPWRAAGLAVGLGGSGVLHLVRPRVYEWLVPPELGSARSWVTGSGVAELATAALLAVPSTRRTGGWAATALLTAFLPAHVHTFRVVPRRPLPLTAAVLRLPLQAPLIAADEGRADPLKGQTLAMAPAPMPDDWQRALVIAAHPDDIEYGLAAVVAAWTSAGKEVHYLLATRGEAGMAGVKPEDAAPIREEEERRSAAVVGVSEVEFLDGRDGVLEAGPELRKAIAGGIRRHRPELVVTGYFGATWSPPGQSPGFLNSPDHRALGQSALDAVADAGNEWIFPDLPEEPWRGVQYVAVSEMLEPMHEVDVTDQVEKAVASLSEHRRYLELLSDTAVEEQARQIVDMIAADESGRRKVGFRLFWG